MQRVNHDQPVSRHARTRSVLARSKKAIAIGAACLFGVVFVGARVSNPGKATLTVAPKEQGQRTLAPPSSFADALNQDSLRSGNDEALQPGTVTPAPRSESTPPVVQSRPS